MMLLCRINMFDFNLQGSWNNLLNVFANDMSLFSLSSRLQVRTGILAKFIGFRLLLNLVNTVG